MASWDFEGMDTFIQMNFETIKRTDKIIRKSIHPGAKYMADEIKQALESIPVQDGHSRYRMRQGITTVQKNSLIESFGIARLRKGTWGYNVKLGFDGYNPIVTKRWPKGQPNAVVARSLNTGTSFLKRYPFMDMTVERCKAQTIKLIEDEFNEQLERVWNGK